MGQAYDSSSGLRDADGEIIATYYFCMSALLHDENLYIDIRVWPTMYFSWTHLISSEHIVCRNRSLGHQMVQRNSRRHAQPRMVSEPAALLSRLQPPSGDPVHFSGGYSGFPTFD